MEKFGPKYIGPITLQSVRSWILDNGFTEADTVLLHSADLERVMEDYRQLYKQPMPDPYFLLGVFIDEATDVFVPENRIVALLGDERLDRPVQRPVGPPEPVDDGSDVFRCGNCGSIVNKDGVILEGTERAHAISLLRMRDGRGAIHVHGECCQQVDEDY